MDGKKGGQKGMGEGKVLGFGSGFVFCFVLLLVCFTCVGQVINPFSVLAFLARPKDLSCFRPSWFALLDLSMM
jgi:hypothetical protein